MNSTSREILIRPWPGIIGGRLKKCRKLETNSFACSVGRCRGVQLRELVSVQFFVWSRGSLERISVLPCSMRVTGFHREKRTKVLPFVVLHPKRPTRTSLVYRNAESSRRTTDDHHFLWVASPLFLIRAAHFFASVLFQRPGLIIWRGASDAPVHGLPRSPDQLRDHLAVQFERSVEGTPPRCVQTIARVHIVQIDVQEGGCCCCCRAPAPVLVDPVRVLHRNDVVGVTKLYSRADIVVVVGDVWQESRVVVFSHEQRRRELGCVEVSNGHQVVNVVVSKPFVAAHHRRSQFDHERRTDGKIGHMLSGVVSQARPVALASIGGDGMHTRPEEADGVPMVVCRH